MSRFSKNNKYGFKHGWTGTRLHNIWLDIRQRCLNQNNKLYKYYGDRGIIICEDWINSFESFRDWALQNDYADNLEIDRKDNNLGYNPENCRWILHIENTQNRRTTKLNPEKIVEIRYKYSSGNYTQQQLADEYNVVNSTIHRIIFKKRWKNI